MNSQGHVLRFWLIFLGLISCAYANDCGTPAISIETVQGQNERSAYVGKRVTLEAVVTADFTAKDSLGGFFIQQEDRDPRASHGLFVYAAFSLKPGDHIRITGEVKEFYDLTELVNVKLLATCGRARIPEPLQVSGNETEREREALEGVLVQMPAAAIQQHDTLSRYGQMAVSTAGRSDNATSVWQIDDASSAQNPERINYLKNIDSIARLAIGNDVEAFTAVLGYSFGEYRLYPLEPLSISPHTLSDPAPGAVRFVSVNAENLFNGDGEGRNFLNNRGPRNEREWLEKQSQMVGAIKAMNADLLVINEVENDGYGSKAAVSQLLESVSKASGMSYNAVEFSEQQRGNAAIQNIILYRPGLLRPVGEPASILSFPPWVDRWHRPFVTQVFETQSGQRIRVVAAHLKSKGGQCPNESSEQRGLFGACVPQRQQAIELLDAWLSELPNYPTLLMGDLNAVPNEPAIQSLLAAGWKKSAAFQYNYSYVFNGVPQILDYILTRDIKPFKVRYADYWRVNSGLPVLRRASLSFETGQCSEFSGFSDHDPVIVDLVE